MAEAPERIALHPATVRRMDGRIYTIEESQPEDVVFIRADVAKAELEAAVVAARAEERERFRAALIAGSRHSSVNYKRDSVLAIIDLPDCVCCAKANQIATAFQHHTNACPVYINNQSALEAARDGGK